jgi:PAS domain S-box-containing protein
MTAPAIASNGAAPAESSAQLTEQRLRDFAAMMTEFLWETGPDHRFTYLSNNTSNLIQRDEEDVRTTVIGKTRWELAGIDPDKDVFWKRHRDDVMARRPFIDLRYLAKGPDGATRHICASGKPIFAADGSFLGYRGVGRNETAMVEGERKRLAAEALLTDAIESFSEGFVIFDAEDRLVMCNSRYRQIYQRCADLLVPGRSFEELLRAAIERGEYAGPIDDKEAWLAERLRQHRNFGVPIEQQLADGRWFLVTEHWMKNGGIAGLRTDITALKKTQEALGISEERYAVALEGTHDGIWDWDLLRNRMFHSARMQEILGFAAVPQEGSNTMTWDLLHPEDLESYRSAVHDLLKGVSDHFESTFRLRGADGGHRWVTSRGKARRGADGRVHRVAGSLRDITAEKEAEARRRREIEEFQRDLEAEIFERARAEEASRQMNQQLSAVIGSSPYAIVGLDRHQNVMLWNRTAEVVFGIGSAEAIGHPIRIFVDEATETFRDVFARASEGELIRGALLSARKKDASILNASVSAAPIHENDGTLRTVVLTLEDVTHRTQIEEQLRQAQRMEAIGQLTGGIAHDFNNMLGVVVGNLDMAIECGGGNSDMLEMCGEALDAALLCTDLVSRLLGFSRKQPLQLATMSVESKLINLLPMLRRSIGENIEITTMIAEQLWPISTDAGRLETALINLAINARDAMPKGGTLLLQARNIERGTDFAKVYPGLEPGEYVSMSLTDNGVGMAPDVVRRCLEPFYTTKGLTGGSGLGLSLVYGLVKQSRGHIRIESEPGVGTMIELLFPRSTQAPTIAAVNAGDEEASLPRGNERILVVEDNSALRRTVVANLTSLGYAVTEADNAATALDILNAAVALDLMFTDVVMPGRLNGVDLAREAERLYPNMRIVFTSGYASSPEVEAEIVASGHPLLAKPYRKSELANQLRAALDAPLVRGKVPAGRVPGMECRPC